MFEHVSLGPIKTHDALRLPDKRYMSNTPSQHLSYPALLNVYRSPFICNR